ncbi:MAG: NAD(+)/NADH kinase [Euryarchaeota archaeon]|nr:NAD(+)/NADH kinase [Euryarchaeota archaeon]
MLKRAGIIFKPARDALSTAREMGEFLDERGVEVVWEKESAARLGEEGVSIGEMKVDLYIVLGGDGMILWACSQGAGHEAPVLGFNFGTTGFLTEAMPGEWRDVLERVLAGEGYVEERTKLKVEVEGEQVGEVLNEAVVAAATPVRMLEMSLKVNGEFVYRLRADGLIVATPTGSTAYSMSAGGPVLDPATPAIVLTPLCPFGSGYRSIVVPDTAEVEVAVEDGKVGGVLVLDGQSTRELDFGAVVRVSLAERRLKLLRLRRDFYRRVREFL